MNLKASLLKDKKLTSEKLRIENQKMELRLQQLKLAMSKEKEERLSNGTQSNWSTGSPGAILNYKPNISRFDSGKKIKLKMLKEEAFAPIAVLPTKIKSSILRDAAAVDGAFSKNDCNNEHNGFGRTGGSRHCGQCEENPAAVNCKECAEDYCPKCFAAFHLKGALRKHRSTPISTLNSRVSIPSPLFKPPDLINLPTRVSQEKKPNNHPGENKNKKYNLKNIENPEELMENSKENELPKYSGPSLAEGNYNEELSNQYFQEAIDAWRGKTEIPNQGQPQNKLPTIEHSTETIIYDKEKKLLSELIHFTPSLTYAEQLLLRKHRSNQLVMDDMSYILNRLTKTNEQELLENKKLLESNLVLETSLINNIAENASMTNQCLVDFESIHQLLKDADLIKDRRSSISSQIIMKSPFKVEELIDPSEENEREENILLQNKLSADSNVNNSLMHEQNNKLDVQSTAENSVGEIGKLDMNPRRSRSVINRRNFYDRPVSARRMSARHNKGGGTIITKPSSLLNILANLSNYLPSTEEDKVENISKSSRPSSSRSFNKISFNFYKLSPNSWKPTQSLSNKMNDDLYNPAKLRNISSVNDDDIDDEMEKELINLNLLSQKPEVCPGDVHSSSLMKSLPHSSSSDDDHDNLFGHIEMDCNDAETEAKDTFEQLNSLERELTIISRQSLESNHPKCDEIITDSLDVTIGNECMNSMDSDKFCFEDSLDFQQRCSKNSSRLPEDVDTEEDDGMLINCSSRFDDYDDVHNLN